MHETDWRNFDFKVFGDFFKFYVRTKSPDQLKLNLSVDLCFCFYKVPLSSEDVSADRHLVSSLTIAGVAVVVVVEIFYTAQ